MILSVTLRSLYALVSHLCLTGLPEVAMPSSDMWQECQITLQHTRPCYTKSSYQSVDPQTLHGNVHQVDHVPDGPTNSAVTTTMFPLRLCGNKPLVAVTREWRYGPSQLRINDNNYNASWLLHVYTVSEKRVMPTLWNIIQFYKSFHCWKGMKFGAKPCNILQPHLRCVAALPWEVKGLNL